MSLHGIKAITLKTGLSAHVIRVWEKRYNAVTPERTETNRRLYSDSDLSRLSTLATLTRQGYSISQIANLPDSELEKLLENNVKPAISAETHFSPRIEAEEHAINHCLKAIESYDQAGLYEVFDQFNIKNGYSSLIEKLIAPLMNQVGAAWHSGNLTTAEEHAATSFIKDYLSQLGYNYSKNSFAYSPTLIATTPSGHLHEIGIVIAASMARKLGWKVIYLGPSLPASEIIGAVRKSNANALLLSLIYPTDDPNVGRELGDLRENLGVAFPILIGGSGVESYRSELEKIQATVVQSNDDLDSALLAIRK